MSHNIFIVMTLYKALYFINSAQNLLFYIVPSFLAIQGGNQTHGLAHARQALFPELHPKILAFFLYLFTTIFYARNLSMVWLVNSQNQIQIFQSYEHFSVMNS